MIKAIITDIEGTTSSISFVKDVLFPYAAQQLPAFLREHAHKQEVKEQIQATAKEIGLNENELEKIIQQLVAWIEEDKKFTPLKALQGMIWKSGYAEGNYAAHIYADALQKLQEWNAQGIPVYIYSSGSIEAQKLFFKHSSAGNILHLFTGHFDTTIGNKKEAKSYQHIVDAVNFPPENILFLSDVVEELDAAKEGGIKTCWVIRKEDYPDIIITDVKSNHMIVESFSKIPSTSSL